MKHDLRTYPSGKGKNKRTSKMANEIQFIPNEIITPLPYPLLPAVSWARCIVFIPRYLLGKRRKHTQTLERVTFP